MTSSLQIISSITLGQLVKPAVQGFFIAWGLLFILLLLPVSPTFGLWFVIALFSAGLGGAVGGVFFFILKHAAVQLWHKILIYPLCLMVFLAAFWLGVIASVNYVGLWN